MVDSSIHLDSYMKDMRLDVNNLSGKIQWVRHFRSTSRKWFINYLNVCYYDADIDECELRNSNPVKYKKLYPCGDDTICKDTPGDYLCKCKFGHRGDGKSEKGCRPLIPGYALAIVGEHTRSPPNNFQLPTQPDIYIYLGIIYINLNRKSESVNTLPIFWFMIWFFSLVMYEVMSCMLKWNIF